MITEPICGQDWYVKHRNDYTQAEIDALGIELKVNGKMQFKSSKQSRLPKGAIKNFVRLNREGKP